MIWIDYAILGVIAISAMIAFFRGFFREVIGLATWILAFWAAYQLAEPAAVLLTDWISARSVRLAVVFGVVFIAVLIVGAIGNYFMGKLVSQTGLAGTDRALGTVFGVLRGVAVLVILVLFAGLTPVPDDDWWHESVFVGHLERGAVWTRDWLPPDLAREIRFGDTPSPESAPQQR